MVKNKHKLSYTQIIAFSFIGIIFVGALLLSLPVASRSGEWTAPPDSFFTATSATCVTGLVVFDTFTHWSLFGQIVIITLIQIGGLGFMTFITMFSVFMHRKIGLHERRLLMQSSGSMRLNGVMQTIKRILLGTLIFEGVGAVILSIRFCPKMGLMCGIYNGIFHSVSAFCNAGFDIMGKYGKFSSFTSYSNDAVVCITVMLLIIIGGIGFLVWNDILRFGFKFKKYELHTKIVLITSFFLILCGWILFYFIEYNHTLNGMSEGDKILNSLFQSVTPRTAGFNTLDQSKLSNSGSIITTVLMFIGGSPGSTAGGIKTTTFIIVILSTVSSARNNSETNVFKRRIDNKTAMQANSIVLIYFLAVLVSVTVISAIEPFGLVDILYETVSAVGTVGLTRGITTLLSPVSKLILMFLMYAGRIGGMSLVLVLAEKRSHIPLERPTEKVLIG